MRKASLKQNHKKLDSALLRYAGFLGKIVHSERVIKTQQEKRDVAESVLLRVCAYWESFVDEHLIDCANVDSSKLAAHFGVPLPKHLSKATCQALLFGDSYRDFKSVGDLKGFSKKVLSDTCNPFLAITSGDAKSIDEVYVIRNYLAHYSFKAKRRLHDLYKKEYDMHNFVEPGQFLMAYNRKRLVRYLTGFMMASAAMKASY